MAASAASARPAATSTRSEAASAALDARFRAYFREASLGPLGPNAAAPPAASAAGLEQLCSPLASLDEPAVRALAATWRKALASGEPLSPSWRLTPGTLDALVREARRNATASAASLSAAFGELLAVLAVETVCWCATVPASAAALALRYYEPEEVERRRAEEEEALRRAPEARAVEAKDDHAASLTEPDPDDFVFERDASSGEEEEEEEEEDEKESTEEEEAETDAAKQSEALKPEGVEQHVRAAPDASVGRARLAIRHIVSEYWSCADVLALESLWDEAGGVGLARRLARLVEVVSQPQQVATEWLWDDVSALTVRRGAFELCRAEMLRNPRTLPVLFPLCVFDVLGLRKDDSPTAPAAAPTLLLLRDACGVSEARGPAAEFLQRWIGQRLAWLDAAVREPALRIDHAECVAAALDWYLAAAHASGNRGAACAELAQRGLLQGVAVAAVREGALGDPAKLAATRGFLLHAVAASPQVAALLAADAELTRVSRSDALERTLPDVCVVWGGILAAASAPSASDKPPQHAVPPRRVIRKGSAALGEAEGRAPWHTWATRVLRRLVEESGALGELREAPEAQVALGRLANAFAMAAALGVGERLSAVEGVGALMESLKAGVAAAHARQAALISRLGTELNELHASSADGDGKVDEAAAAASAVEPPQHSSATARDTEVRLERATATLRALRRLQDSLRECARGDGAGAKRD